MKVLIGFQSYEGDSPAQVGQRLVNMYAEKNPDLVGITASVRTGMELMVASKYPYTMITTPGQKLWLDLGTKAAIQGMQVMGGKLYAVSNNKVFVITPAMASTQLTGAITGVGDQVDMANNGQQMAIVSSDGTGWVANPSTLAQITDGNYPAGGASSVAYIESFGFFGYSDSIQFGITNSYDFTTWPGDFSSVISSPANLVRVVSFNDALWLFAADAYEVWGYTGAAAFPFQIQSGVANTTRGLAAKFAVAQDDNTLFFLGNDGIVYRINGYAPSRISNPSVEIAITGYKIATGISDAIMHTYTQKGHKFLVLTFPASNATWVCDVSQNLWHERQAYLGQRWNPSCIIEFAGKILVGDYNVGKIYELDPLTYADDGRAIQRVLQGAVTWEGGVRIIHDRIRLDLDAGIGLATGQGSDPQVMMRYSDDGGRTYSNERWASAGKIGEYKTLTQWRRNGQSRERIYRFEMTDPVPWRVTGAYADIREGRA